MSKQIEKCAQARIRVDAEAAKEAEARNVSKFGANWKREDVQKASKPSPTENPEKPKFGGPLFSYLESDQDRPEIVLSAAEIEFQARLICLSAAAGTNK
jgi:hypothetical protein